ncbi:MAG: NAD-dependent epimerase/dehydratase family protein [Acidobacteria bacterium]|nr:NAD-dependent epimerase/dehydratase family protein [Acidobacteriota bacterium]
MMGILGAGGAIGGELAKLYGARRERVRLVGRNPKPAGAHTETVAADLANPEDATRAVEGTEIAFLLAGLKYDVAAWRELWPRIMRNTIDACKRAGARLVFFDNVYMYGRVDGPMTEEAPFRPCSAKGEIRARIASTLLEEMAAGRITATIARAADFYGPGVRTGVPNLLVFDKLKAGAKPMCLANDAVPHSYTYTPDAARALLLLAESDVAWGQTWHLPTASDPPTGKEFIELAAKEFARPAKYRVLSRGMMRIGGWFNSEIRELVEMLYQNEFPYVFDSGKFERAFALSPTPYAEGIRACVKA